MQGEERHRHLLDSLLANDRKVWPETSHVQTRLPWGRLSEALLVVHETQLFVPKEHFVDKEFQRARRQR